MAISQDIHELLFVCPKWDSVGLHPGQYENVPCFVTYNDHLPKDNLQNETLSVFKYDQTQHLGI